MDDPQVWLGIIGLLVSTGVAYHIAFRQGGLPRARGRIWYGRIPSKAEHPKQPWLILVVLPAVSTERYAVEFPVSIAVGRTPLKNVWIQLAYARGRHAAAAVKSVVQSDEPDDTYRRFDMGPFSYMEAKYPSTNADDRIVLVDMVAWKADELMDAEYRRPEGSGMVSPSPFRWTADKVTVTLRAENQPETSFTFWLAALASVDPSGLEQQVALVAEAVMQKDGIRIAKAQPGRRAWYQKRNARHGLLVTPKFETRTGTAAVDRLADSERSIQEIEFFPVGNALSPTLTNA
jgi:hypothetical protein